MNPLECAGLAALHRLDPERAHGLAIRALSLGLVPLACTVTSPRLATRLELVDPRSPWGDCEVVLAVDNREVLRRRLSAEESGADVVVDLAGAAVLKLSIEPGKYGPIRDRVALRRPLILVAP